jgi:hypothetical protein
MLKHIYNNRNGGIRMTDDTKELEPIRNEERRKMLSKELDRIDEELGHSKHCQYCYYAFDGPNYNNGRLCKTCNHKSNFRRILGKDLQNNKKKRFNIKLKKVLYYKEYESHIVYGYDEQHKVKTHIEVAVLFDFKEGLRFSVGVANTSFCCRNIFKAFIKILEHESIGMQKYKQMKEDAKYSGLYGKLYVKIRKED